jgi:hypothetical protein
VRRARAQQQDGKSVGGGVTWVAYEFCGLRRHDYSVGVRLPITDRSGQILAEVLKAGHRPPHIHIPHVRDIHIRDIRIRVHCRGMEH